MMKLLLTMIDCSPFYTANDGFLLKMMDFSGLGEEQLGWLREQVLDAARQGER